MKLLKDGAELFPNVLCERELSRLYDLADRHGGAGAGKRLAHDEILSLILSSGSSMQKIAERLLGKDAKPVRAILFDKHPGANWALGWHQDRTIAVLAKKDTPGFGPWSIKSGIIHVEPPFEIVAGMVTLRAHLDDCGTDNAPLRILTGSHLSGRIPVADIEDLVAKSPIAECTANSGDVWACASSIIHASNAAKHPVHRRVLHIDYSKQQLPNGLEWSGV